MDAFASVLAGPGRVYSQAEWAPLYAKYTPNINSSLYDTKSHGYEFSAIANPTPQWRLVANYSYTYRRASNTYSYDVVPWYGFKLDDRGLITQGVRQAADGRFVVDAGAFSPDGTIAGWLELAAKDPRAALSNLVTSGNRTVAQEIYMSIEGANEFKSLQEQRWGLRPHKVSFFTAYDFAEGRLKGFTLGGGVRWQSKNVIGANAGGREMQGRAIQEADLMLRYRWRNPVRWLKGALILQCNVSNLFNESGIIPKYLSSTADFIVPGGRGIGYSRFDLIDPRAFRFTATYEF
jgi:outer membrane receptor protein involved in Fe transport